MNVGIPTFKYYYRPKYIMQNIIMNAKKVERTLMYIQPQIRKKNIEIQKLENSMVETKKKIGNLEKEIHDVKSKHLRRYYIRKCPRCGDITYISMLKYNNNEQECENCILDHRRECIKQIIVAISDSRIDNIKIIDMPLKPPTVLNGETKYIIKYKYIDIHDISHYIDIPKDIVDEVANLKENNAEKIREILKTHHK